jgi:hypothetical protein
MNEPLHDDLPDFGAGEVVEVPLLLPGWQVVALEQVAHERGLTAGQMLRQALGALFPRVPGPR